MIVCDICSAPGKGTIITHEQMKKAVFKKGFNPFKLGLSRKSKIYLTHGAGAYEYWKTNIVGQDMTNWNICPKCWKHLKKYIDESPREKSCFYCGTIQYTNESVKCITCGAIICAPCLREHRSNLWQTGDVSGAISCPKCGGILVPLLLRTSSDSVDLSKGHKKGWQFWKK